MLWLPPYFCLTFSFLRRIILAMVDVPLRGCKNGKGTLNYSTFKNGRLSEILRKPCQERYFMYRSFFLLLVGGVTSQSTGKGMYL